MTNATWDLIISLFATLSPVTYPRNWGLLLKAKLSKWILWSTDPDRYIFAMLKGKMQLDVEVSPPVVII